MKIISNVKKVGLVLLCLFPVISAAEVFDSYDPYLDEPYYQYQQPGSSSYEDPRTQYPNHIDVYPGALSIPTVISVPVPETTEATLVYEVATGEYVGSLEEERLETRQTLETIEFGYSSNGTRGEANYLLDNNADTSVDFLVTGTSSILNHTELLLNSPANIPVSQLTLLYAENSPRPQAIVLFAIGADGSEEVVFRSDPAESDRLYFPERYGQYWRLLLYYEQPIRVSALGFGPVWTTSVLETVRFLAQPNQTYMVYLNPVRPVYAPLRDSGKLNQIEAVPAAMVSELRPNPLFKQDDADADLVPDTIDNCPADYNPDQMSARGTGKGDVCDDFDNDGYANTIDNCPDLPNNQLDEDGDMIGDACDKVESRLTEQYPWLPWVGMGITLLVIISLFLMVARRPLTVAEEEVLTGSDSGQV